MPTIKDKLAFNFNGVSSDQFGLVHISLDNGMYEETFVSSRELVETKSKGSNKALLHSIDDSMLEFDMTIAFENKYTDNDIDGIIRWLFVDQFKPLYFEGSENKVYMCLPTGDASIIHNGLNEGYFTIHMRCDSSNVYSQYITSNLETITTNKTITIENNGHFDVYPEISIKKNGAGKITIESLDNYGAIFEVLNLTNQEDIYINCEKETIETDLLGTYRYDDLIGEFPKLVYGSNRLKITGACTIQLRYKNKYRF